MSGEVCDEIRFEYAGSFSSDDFTPAISGNIANADTPGYRPKAVSFEQNLQRALATKSSEAINRVDVKVEDVDDGIPRLDGNSVSLDKQMANLAENQTLYQATAEFLRKKMGMIKRAIG